MGVRPDDAGVSRLARKHTATTQQVIREEKTRITRELHDVVAHQISVITAQAAGAQRVFDTEPEMAREALRSIETTGRGALIEMRRLLDVLQIESGEAEIAPQPGLDQLPFFIAEMGRAGLTVQLCLRGPARRLPPGVELNAFRIIQEALTNTLKHAGRSQAQVELSYHPTRLDLRINDNGGGFGANAVPGHGLISMRRRAHLLGGELLVGPGSTGGVQVCTSLPTEAQPRRKQTSGAL